MNFVTGTLSPVSAASSILRLALSSSLPSAGTASPASSSTTSPTTSSAEGTTVTLPPRSTRLVAADIACSASIAFSALFSWYTPRAAFTMTTNSMIITSAAPSPW